MTSTLEAARFEQLDRLGGFDHGNHPVLIHGSVGHAIMMGVGLPSMEKQYGQLRDIDIYAPHTDKLGIEGAVAEAGMADPSPVDGGLSGLLVYEGDTPYICKDGVAVVLQDAGIFSEVETYDVPGADGLQVRGFTPAAMRAVHSLEPRVVRPGHIKAYRDLNIWFKEQEVALPAELTASIEEFHRAYRARYPYGILLRQLADAYVTFVPESMRKRARHHTHRFMRKHAGRVSPYAD